MTTKYRVTIEFETDKPLKFPHDAQLLQYMEVQLESLSDGTISQQYKVTYTTPSKVEEL